VPTMPVVSKKQHGSGASRCREHAVRFNQMRRCLIDGGWKLKRTRPITVGGRPYGLSFSFSSRGGGYSVPVDWPVSLTKVRTYLLDPEAAKKRFFEWARVWFELRRIGLYERSEPFISWGQDYLKGNSFVKVLGPNQSRVGICDVEPLATYYDSFDPVKCLKVKNIHTGYYLEGQYKYKVSDLPVRPCDLRRLRNGYDFLCFFTINVPDTRPDYKPGHRPQPLISGSSNLHKGHARTGQRSAGPNPHGVGITEMPQLVVGRVRKGAPMTKNWTGCEDNLPKGTYKEPPPKLPPYRPPTRVPGPVVDYRSMSPAQVAVELRNHALEFGEVKPSQVYHPGLGTFCDGVMWTRRSRITLEL